ncbi:hypothetical protein J437_LFUL002082 [Ladona fulva]|uniref:LYR motif-containing protein 2 n=1 Tax=Ladona fulva TaxID=123851 RepID=A0A8K0JZI8_LADFU|nr:hypothetical protein J437_LFUL002082 [Ladona fulva]
MAGRIKSMSLKQFMIRQDVLSLYRKLFRAIRNVPGETNRKELQDWVRSDFKKNMHHEDEIVPSHIMKNVDTKVIAVRVYYK